MTTNIKKTVHLATNFPSEAGLRAALNELGLKGRVQRAMYNHIYSRLDGSEFVMVNVVGNKVEVVRGADHPVEDRGLARLISAELNKQGFKTTA